MPVLMLDELHVAVTALELTTAPEMTSFEFPLTKGLRPVTVTKGYVSATKLITTLAFEIWWKEFVT